MRRLLCCISFIYFFFHQPVFACGPDWTYSGRDLYGTTRIHELLDSAGVLLRVGSDSGVYRWSTQDTV
jgi:hypothetical protein